MSGETVMWMLLGAAVGTILGNVVAWSFIFWWETRRG